MNLFNELFLPNGSVIKNRIAKAAMEENLADYDHTPSERLLKLYKSWADGGAGLIITGNVMVDRRAATGPGGVILEDDHALSKFKIWAKVIKANGAQAWMQINHPGRQMPKDMGQETLAPSAIALNLGPSSKAFGMPREMTHSEIEEIIGRFVKTATLAEQAGFSGVEIHAAHGYLISQFLSPLANRRTDQWGGSIINRSRFLIEVVNGVRSKVSKNFVVAVKLNSADFQRGGFSPEDAKFVITQLNDLGVDVVELSGGSYEAPAMTGKAKNENTAKREAYFLEFAKDISSVAKMPLMVTGGIRRKVVAEEVLNSGVAIVGIATALSLNPQLPNNWANDIESSPALRPVDWKNKPLASMASMAMVRHQFRRIAKGKSIDSDVAPLKAFLVDAVCRKLGARDYRRWISK